MSRRRRYAARRRRSPPFRAWGTVLFVLLMLTLTQRNWSASAWIGAALVFYLLAVRLTLCRVETLRPRRAAGGCAGCGAAATTTLA
ncbi:MAG: hypothetical protein M3Z25_10290 [Actinomycetota bacterium]|nr:hypothetical protein [Actinomycetota bacterium]